MAKKLKAGDIVKVVREDYETDWTGGLTGTVVRRKKKDELYYPGDLDVLVEFSPKDAEEQGHNDEGGEGMRRWWIASANLERVDPDTLTLGVETAVTSAPFRPGSQTSTILGHLLNGKSISNNESLLVYHIYRLSDCIHKIRKAGYDVVCDIKTDEVGGKYADYRLAQKAA
jgi:hypothetical protein